MNSDKLLKRQRFVKATPLKDRAETRSSTRRSNNHVVMNTEKGSEFDNFFEFEEDLSEIKPSNAQAEALNVESRGPAPIAMEPESFVHVERSHIENSCVEMEPEEAPVASDSFVCMEPEKINIKKKSAKKDKPDYMKVKGFKFKQCSHIKKDGDQCKRQAPKSNNLCSIHRRIEKSKKNQNF